jgi:hypothetical protein
LHHAADAGAALVNNDRREFDEESLIARSFAPEPDYVLYERDLLEEQDLYARADFDDEYIFARSFDDFYYDLD